MSSVNNDFYLNNTNNVIAKTAIKGKSADQMDMNDFFNLFAAQMTNQDMLNPQDNTEFVAQMAQFTSLQGIKQIQEYQLSSYAVSYVGKNVTIAEANEYTNELETITGTVEGVTFYDGSPQVVVNGKTYSLYKIMEVNSSSSGNSALNEWANYVGKNVRILHENEDGEPETINGRVERITLIDGKPYVVVNGKEYPAKEVQSIISDESAESAALAQEAEEYAKNIGKMANIRQLDENGNEMIISGKITDTSYYNNQWYVTVDDKDYPVSDIQKIYEN